MGTVLKAPGSTQATQSSSQRKGLAHKGEGRLAQSVPRIVPSSADTLSKTVCWQTAQAVRELREK